MRVYNHYPSLKMHTRFILQTWGQTLVCSTLRQTLFREDDLVNSIWQHLPLKRSRSTPVPLTDFSKVDQADIVQADIVQADIIQTEYPIVYQSALFPWLTSAFPQPGGTHFWERQTLDLLPQWFESCPQDWQQDFKLHILPQHGLKVEISGPAIVSHLRQWLQSNPACPVPPESLRQRLADKTGGGCELHYYHDRCQQLHNLALRQGWLPPREPWPQLTWQQSFQDWWPTDPTGRSLLEAWIDQTDALLEAPQRLITRIPQFLQILEQYDRAHAWGTLAQTLPPEQFWGYCALMAASDRILTLLF